MKYVWFCLYIFHFEKRQKVGTSSYDYREDVFMKQQQNDILLHVFCLLKISLFDFRVRKVSQCLKLRIYAL